MTDARDELLTVKEVAQACGVHPNTVRRWIDEGLIETWSVLPTSRVRIPRSEVDRLQQPRVRPSRADGPLLL